MQRRDLPFRNYEMLCLLAGRAGLVQPSIWSHRQSFTKQQLLRAGSTVRSLGFEPLLYPYFATMNKLPATPQAAFSYVK